MLNPTLESKLKHLPTRPGVYLMKDAAGEILYVGKAKSLRSRVRSYFASGAQHGIKTHELVRRVVDLDTIVVDTEAEALILENNLIKEHRPASTSTSRTTRPTRTSRSPSTSASPACGSPAAW
jgi:excinuclease ABC subunit C